MSLFLGIEWSKLECLRRDSMKCLSSCLIFETFPTWWQCQKNTMVFHLFQMEHINVGKNIWRDEPNTWDYHWLLVLICDYLQAHKDSLINKPSFVVEKRRIWTKRHSDSWLHAVFVLLSSDSVLCCCSRATIASR